MPDTHITLPSGYTISRIIKGGWQLAGGHGEIDHDRALADMEAFVAAGVDTFDCADIYTGVESLIGDFLRWRAGKAASETLPTVRVHTKFVPDLDALAALSGDDISAIIDRSRQRLGVGALDLVQFHWWDYSRGNFIAAARVLAQLRERGVIRNIGTTNFDTAHLGQLLDAGVPVVSHQVQYSLLDRRAAGAMTELCATRGVALLAYGALAGGFFSERWLGADDPQRSLENRSLVKYRLIIDEYGGWGAFQSLLHTLHDIAQRHGVRIGTVAIRWTLDQPCVAAAIVGARHSAHLEHTVQALSLQLTEGDHAELRAAITPHAGPTGEVYELERDREGAHGRIMKYNLNVAH